MNNSKILTQNLFYTAGIGGGTFYLSDCGRICVGYILQGDNSASHFYITDFLHFH